MLQTAQQVYQNLLNSDLSPILKFKSNKSTIMYPDAFKYPSFFDNNLLSPGRVIKIVKGKSALLRSFAYQLMKLAFQIQVLEIDYIDLLKKVVFSPNLLYESDVQSPISGQAYTDNQYKRILADFIQIMIRQNIPNFELTIMVYPIIQEALVRILELLIISEYSFQQNNEEILQWLSMKFHITMQRYGMCYKFEESDIFLYEQSEEQFYIAFLNEMAEVSDYSQSTNRLDLMSPDTLKNHNEEEEDQNFKNSSSDITPSEQQKDVDLYPQDKYRYSVNVNKKSSSSFPYHKTIDNHKMFIKEIRESQNDDNSNDKPEDKYSKIGSLVDLLSDRSSKELSQNFKTPESITERHPQQDKKSIRIQYEQKTPQFNTKMYQQTYDNYNPFINKYSDQYLGNIYQKNDPFTYLSSNQNNNFLDNQYNYKNYREYQSTDHYQLTKPIKPYTSNQQYTSQPYSSNQPYTSSQPYTSNQPYDYSYPNTSKYAQQAPTFNHNYQKNTSSKNNYFFEKAELKYQQQDMFYNPKKPKNGANQVQKYDVIKKKYNFQEKDDESKGTLYKEFTDTRLLQMVTSFERLKISNIKKRYKGVTHRKSKKPLF